MFFKPMLLETASNPFNSSDFIFEGKYDGIRLEYSNVNSPILYTRNGNIVTQQFPELLTKPIPDIILDGEAIVQDGEGGDDFEGIIRRLRLRKQEKISAAIGALPVTYYIFDILYHKGQDLRQKPLMERKEILLEAVAPHQNERIKIIQWINAEGISLFNEIKERSMEGIIAKEKNSLYLPRRSNKWLKIINWIDIEGIIYGYRKEDNALLCQWSSGQEIGVVHQGMTPEEKSAFLKIAKSIIIEEDSKAVYVEPVLRCKLKGRGITSSGLVRSPVFVDFIL